MAQIEIGVETQTANGWSYQVSVFADGRRHTYQVTLGWADYDLWCHGRSAPSKVVHKAFGFLLERESAGEIMAKFDCSVIRRYFPEVDKLLAGMI